MVTKTIKYKGFDGEDIEEKIYLRLTVAEFEKLNRSYQSKGGFVNYFRKMLTELQQTAKAGSELDYTTVSPLIEFVEAIILAAYGERTEDGKFIKKRYGQPLADEFECSQAYSELITGFFGSEEGMKEMEDLIIGILPLDESDKTIVQEKKTQLLEQFQKG